MIIFSGLENSIFLKKTVLTEIFYKFQPILSLTFQSKSEECFIIKNYYSHRYHYQKHLLCYCYYDMLMLLSHIIITYYYHMLLSHININAIIPNSLELIVFNFVQIQL